MKPLSLLVNIAQLLFLFVWTAAWITLAFAAAVLTLNRDIPLVMARRCWAPALVRLSGARFALDPLPEVDWSRPHVFVMNHQSMLDIACAFAAIPSNIRFVAKHVLAYVPFLGWYMWMTGMVFVNRSQRAKALRSMALAGRRIRAGASILVFPEGTRSRDGRVLPFKKGSFALALEAKVPVVPIAIEGSLWVSPPGSLRFRSGPVRMRIGTPIPTAHLSPDDRETLMRQVRQAVIRLHREIGGRGGDEVEAPALAPVPVPSP